MSAPTRSEQTAIQSVRRGACALQPSGDPDGASDDADLLGEAFVAVVFGVEGLEHDLGWLGVGQVLDPLGDEPRGGPPRLAQLPSWRRSPCRASNTSSSTRWPTSSSRATNERFRKIIGPGATFPTRDGRNRRTPIERGSVVGRPTRRLGDFAPLLKHFGTVARMGMPGSADRLARSRRERRFRQAAGGGFPRLPYVTGHPRTLPDKRRLPKG